MPSVSGNLGAVFNGGTLTNQTVLAPANKDTTALQIKPVSGATADATNELELYADDGTTQLVVFDAAGDAQFTIPSGSGSQFVVDVGSHAALHVDDSSSLVTVGLPAGYSFRVLDHSNVKLIDVAEASDAIGLFGATPVAQAAAITPPAGGVTVDSQARTAIGSIITALHNLGITA